MPQNETTKDRIPEYRWRDPYDADRATEIRHDAHFPNETSTTHALLALQIVLLQDIRFYLRNLDEVIRNQRT